MNEHFSFIRKPDEGGIVEAGTATIKIKADTTEFDQQMGELLTVRPSWFSIAYRVAEIGLLLFIAIKV